jgi:TRAP transporter TAXI family solute receptor
VDVRAIGMGGSSVFIPQVNSGELDFGTSNSFESVFATQGTGYFSGNPNPNIRVVATLVPYRVGIMVPDASDVRTLQDLEGKPFPAKYSSMKLVESIQNAIFKAVGMDENSIRPVAVPNFVKGAELMAEGRVAGVLLAPGSGVTKKTNAQVPIRFLSIPDTPETQASVSSDLPGASIVEVQPRGNLAGITEPINLIGYQYVLLANKDVDDDRVYRMVKAIAENKELLIESHGIFRGFVPEQMMASLPGAEFHPGAVKYYTEQGWVPSN